MQLYRKIKELAGQSPSEFIRTLRMKFAARQIITTAKTLQEIMYESGVNNKAYFFREFGSLKCHPVNIAISINKRFERIRDVHWIHRLGRRIIAAAYLLQHT